MAGGQARAAGRRLGQLLAQARLLGLEGLRVHLHAPVGPVPSLQQPDAAPELPGERGAERGRAALPPGLPEPRQLDQVEGGGEPVGGPGRQVVGLVEEHEAPRALLRRAEEPLHRGVGGQDVVVVADDHVGVPGRVQGELEGAQEVPIGGFPQQGRVGAPRLRQFLQDARVLQAVVVAPGPGADLRRAVDLLLGAHLLLGPQGHGAHRVAPLPQEPDEALRRGVLAVAGRGVEHPQVLHERLPQGRMEEGRRLAQARRGLDQQGPLPP